MKCIYCDYHDTRVINSRLTAKNEVKRRRECQNCKLRFTTYEWAGVRWKRDDRE